MVSHFLPSVPCYASRYKNSNLELSDGVYTEALAERLHEETYSLCNRDRDTARHTDHLTLLFQNHGGVKVCWSGIDKEKKKNKCLQSYVKAELAERSKTKGVHF